jgi:hypothetical protein
MRGFPAQFATKQDYFNCLTLYPEETKAALSRLLADRYTWEKTKELDAVTDGITDETHRVIAQKKTDEETGEKAYVQLEKVEDKNAALFRLGFTAGEVQKLIA